MHVLVYLCNPNEIDTELGMGARQLLKEPVYRSSMGSNEIQLWS